MHRRSTEIRLTRYLAMAGGALALHPAAQAGVVTKNINTLLTYDLYPNTLYLDVDSDGFDDFFFAMFSNSGGTLAISPSNLGQVYGGGTGSYYSHAAWGYASNSTSTSLAMRLGPGEDVSTTVGANWYPYSGLTLDLFEPQGTGYLPFQFYLASEDRDVYGYFTIDTSDSVELVNAVYEDSGNSLSTPGGGPAVPEPTSLSLLALGAGAAVALRGRLRR